MNSTNFVSGAFSEVRAGRARVYPALPVFLAVVALGFRELPDGPEGKGTDCG
jgi:hypothetical protein